MESYVGFLKSISATSLTSGCTFWTTDVILAIICGLWLLFLFLPYLPLPPPKKNININKPRVQTRNKDGNVQALRSCQKELNEARYLIKLLQTHLGKPPNKGSFCQQKYREHSGPVQKRASADVHCRPCVKRRADSTNTASLPQIPRSLASTTSAKPPESPSDWMTKHSSDWKTVSERRSSGNLHDLESSVPTTTNLEGISRPVSTFSCWWEAAKALLLPTWTHCSESQQEYTSHQQSKASFWRSTTNVSIKDGSPSVPNPDVQKVLDTEISKKAEMKIWEEKEKNESFTKQMISKYHLHSLGKLESLSAGQTTTAPSPSGTKPSSCPVLSSSHIPRPWGPMKTRNLSGSSGASPLRDESPVTPACISGNSSPSALSNSLSHACPVQVSSPFSQPQPLPPLEVQIQPSVPTTPHPQALPLAPVLTQERFQPSFPAPPPPPPPPPPSTAQMRPHEGSCPIAWSPLNPNLSQDNRASETHKSDSVISGDELRKQLEQHLQTRLTQYQRSLPSRIQDTAITKFVEQTQPSQKLPGTCQVKSQHGSSWPVGTGESRKDVKEDLGKDLEHNLGEMPKYGLSQDSETSSVKALRRGSEELKCDLMNYSSSNTENYILRNPDKEHLENTLKAHLDRKLRKIIKGQIPICVRRSWLTANHILPKSDTCRNPGSLVGSEDHTRCVNTTQESPFLDADTRQTLEAHMIRFRVRHKWDLTLWMEEAMNPNWNETQPPSSLSQNEFPSSVIQEPWASSKGNAAMFWGENSQTGCGEKATSKKSAPTLEKRLPTLSPAGEEVQGVLRQTLPSNDPRPSEAAQGGREGRQSCQPITTSTVGRTLESPELTPSQPVTRKGTRETSLLEASPNVAVARLEMNDKSQSSRVKETRANGSSAPQQHNRDTMRTSVLAKSQTINVDFRGLEIPKTSQCPSPTRTSVQDPGKTHLKAQVLSDVEFEMELKTAGQSQDCPPGVDGLQACTADVLLASDLLASQVSQSHLKCGSNEDMPVLKMLSDLMSAGGSSLGQQDPPIPKLHDPWKSKDKTSVPSDERTDFRSLKPTDCEEGLVRLGVSAASGTSLPAQEKRSVESLGIKCPQLPTEKGHTPPESHFKNKMRNILQSICPRKKDKGQDDLLQKGKPASAFAQNHGQCKSRSVSTGKGGTEITTIVTAVGQSLAEKLRLQKTLYASKLNQQRELKVESQDLASGHPSYHKAHSYPEAMREMGDALCWHQVTVEGQSSLRTSWTQEGDRNPYTTVGLKITDWALPPRGPVSSMSPCHYGSRMWGASGCPHHSTFCHHRGFSWSDQVGSPPAFVYQKRKPVYSHVSTFPIC